MNNGDSYIDFYRKLENPFLRSDQELWAQINAHTQTEPKLKIFHLNLVRYAAAATVLIIVGITLFMRFYAETVISEKGKHLSYVLPDGSNLVLNAETSISFNPYWWNFNKELSLAGEALSGVVHFPPGVLGFMRIIGEIALGLKHHMPVRFLEGVLWDGQHSHGDTVCELDPSRGDGKSHYELPFLLVK